MDFNIRPQLVRKFWSMYIVDLRRIEVIGKKQKSKSKEVTISIGLLPSMSFYFKIERYTLLKKYQTHNFIRKKT